MSRESMTEPEDKPGGDAGHELDRLAAIMAQLRNPENGCPWDLEQTFKTIAPYTVEEAYEVADAIEREDDHALREELGDLLFQTVFHAQIAAEAGSFDLSDVVHAISDKMVRRHPHVFGDANERSADEQTASWEKQKAEERAAKGASRLLDDVPVGLPGLTRAVKLQKRAARVGFDWTRAKDILAKLSEEAAELVEAQTELSADAIEDEFGDLLFVMANLGRHLNVDPEAALRRANAKFIRRFNYIEDTLTSRGKVLADVALDEMEALWVEAKSLEKNAEQTAGNKKD
ncbi:MAG: nucleoside triphosphate pyrophosphohydrolase [Pseudomonadota bacterium]